MITGLVIGLALGVLLGMGIMEAKIRRMRLALLRKLDSATVVLERSSTHLAQAQMILDKGEHS